VAPTARGTPEGPIGAEVVIAPVPRLTTEVSEGAVEPPGGSNPSLDPLFREPRSRVGSLNQLRRNPIENPSREPANLRGFFLGELPCLVLDAILLVKHLGNLSNCNLGLC